MGETQPALRTRDLLEEVMSIKGDSDWSTTAFPSFTSFEGVKVGEEGPADVHSPKAQGRDGASLIVIGGLPTSGGCPPVQLSPILAPTPLPAQRTALCNPGRSLISNLPYKHCELLRLNNTYNRPDVLKIVCCFMA